MPVPDHPGIDPGSQQQVHRVDDDGFAGAGFAAQNGQSTVETDIQVVDDGEIFD